jgi:hypothetical protein
MRIRSIVISFALAAVCAIPTHAQYKEMSKVEALARNSNEQQMLASLSMHLGVPAETLKQEMDSNNLNFGQLYLAHAIARASNTDFNSILSDSKNKLWTTIAEERKLDMKQIAADESKFEETHKKLKTSR